MPTRTDICIICAGEFQNKIGFQGRPKRYCSDDCRVRAQLTNDRFCQVCKCAYVTDDGRRSFCSECSGKTVKAAGLKRCARCRQLFKQSNVREIYCTVRCRTEAVGPRPFCMLPGCKAKVHDGANRGSWPKFCSDSHRAKHMAGNFTDVQVDVPMNRTFRQWKEFGETKVPPLDAWGRPWLKPAAAQAVITEANLPKHLKEKLGIMRKMIELMNARTNWDKLEDPASDTKTLNLADWAWMLGASFYEFGGWPVIPWLWEAIPVPAQRIAAQAVKYTLRSPGYVRTTDSAMERRQEDYERSKEALEGMSSNGRPHGNRANALQERVRQHENFFKAYENGEVYPCVTAYISSGVIALPDEHVRMTDLQLRSTYRKRCLKLWKDLK